MAVIANWALGVGTIFNEDLMQRTLFVLFNLFLKASAAALAILVTIMVARQLGAANAGVFFFSQNIMVLLIAASRFGFDNSMVREAALLDRDRDHDALQAVFSTGITLMTGFAIVFSVAAFVVIWVLGLLGVLAQSGYVPISLMLITGLPFLTFSSAVGFFLQGRGKLGPSTFLIFAAHPLTLLLLLFLLPPANATGVAWLYVVAAVASAVLAGVFALRLLPELSLCPRLRGLSARTKAGSRSFWFVSMTNQAVVLLPMLILSHWGGPHDVAYFIIAQRVANLTGNVVVAVNSFFAPQVSSAQVLGGQAVLRTTLIAQAYTFALGAPILAIPLLFPDLILWLFGDEFEAARTALILISLGQFYNVATSATSVVLGMCGKERLMSISGFIALGFSLGLGLFLIPSMHLIGACIVSVAALVLQNSLYLVHAVRHIRALKSQSVDS